MRKRWLGILALCLLTVFTTNVTIARSASAEEVPGDYGDQVIVQYATPESQVVPGAPAPSLQDQGFRELTVPAGMTRDQFIAQLKERPDVLSAEADGPAYAADIPDDPYYLPNQAPYLEQVNAPGAWSIETGDYRIVVAVLDSGIDLNHPDLQGRLWQNAKDSYSDGIDHDQNGCVNDRYGCRFITVTGQNAAACGYTSSTPTGNVGDDNGTSASNPGSHGTFVSGIVGAAGDNGQGVTGIDWDVQLMTVKVLDCGSDSGRPRGSIADVARGIDYARMMGANIINLSLATTQDSSILRTAVEQAQAQGIIIVAAAGNFGSTASPGPGYPAAYAADDPDVISVAASDNLNGNQWASYSAYGPSISLAAPGNKITSTIRSNLGINPPYGEAGSPDQGYAGGTSFAAPQVSGMFALMMARNPGLGAAEYIRLAKSAATPAPAGPPNWAGAGIINIGKAVSSVPMTISGAALNDWMDAPPGGDVRALINGVSCGETNVTAVGRLSNYDIRVASASERPGCGTPGAVVQISINGQPAFPTITWGGKNQDIGLDGRDVSTISAEPGPNVTQQLNGSWSNIAQLGPSGPPAIVLNSLPTPWTAAYYFDTAVISFDGQPGTYLHYLQAAPIVTSTWPMVHTYDAFWVNGPSTSFTSPNPDPQGPRTVGLRKGWNNITYTGTNRAVADALTSISGEYSTVMRFNNATRTWLMYTPTAARYNDDFGGLFTLDVYWIYMTRDGSLTMR